MKSAIILLLTVVNLGLILGEPNVDTYAEGQHGIDIKPQRQTDVHTEAERTLDADTKAEEETGAHTTPEKLTDVDTEAERPPGVDTKVEEQSDSDTKAGGKSGVDTEPESQTGIDRVAERPPRVDAKAEEQNDVHTNVGGKNDIDIKTEGQTDVYTETEGELGGEDLEQSVTDKNIVDKDLTEKAAHKEERATCIGTMFGNTINATISSSDYVYILGTISGNLVAGHEYYFYNSEDPCVTNKTLRFSERIGSTIASPDDHMKPTAGLSHLVATITSLRQMANTSIVFTEQKTEGQNDTYIACCNVTINSN